MFYRYILTRRVEKLIPFRRLTAIIMPHRSKYAGLHPPKETRSNTTLVDSDKEISKFRTLSAIQALKYGLEKKLNRTKGWLF